MTVTVMYYIIKKYSAFLVKKNIIKCRVFKVTKYILGCPKVIRRKHRKTFFSRFFYESNDFESGDPGFDLRSGCPYERHVCSSRHAFYVN